MKGIIYYLSFLISYIVAHDCDISISTTLPIPPIISSSLRPTITIMINPRPSVNITLIQTKTQNSQTQSSQTQSQIPSQTIEIPIQPTQSPILLPPPIPSPQPILSPTIDTNIVTYKLKATDIYDMLKTHNDERNITNLDNLSWDINLQSSSELWSRELALKNCALEHKLFSSAQNLYGGYGWLEPNFKDAIQLWINEKELLNEPNITFQDVGHYLIIVSDNYSEVGCGAALNLANNCFVVTCNYN